jgi:hypothetical protein
VVGRVTYHTALPSSLNEYRTKHASTESLEVLQIPHTQDLKMAGSEGTSVNTGHCSDRIYGSLDFIVEPYMKRP